MEHVLTDTVLVGIDEAGLGPLLGPLMISAVSFTVPEKCLTADLWTLLSDSVSCSRKNLAGRMLLCDSKKAYTAGKGIGDLEKTVLCGLKVLGRKPHSIADLLRMVCVDCNGRLAGYPWYQQFAGDAVSGGDGISVSASAFKRDLQKNRMALHEITGCCLDVAYYNDMVAKVNNKSTVVFSAVCRLVARLIKKTQHKNYHFIIDRQGGRTHYVQHLRRMFADMQLVVVSEDENLSSYIMSTSYKTVKIDFRVKADADSLPVAMASMVSKYLREKLMGCINSYFISKCDSLKPTAGYWTDGQRFLKDIKDVAGHIKYNPKQLIRCR